MNHSNSIKIIQNNHTQYKYFIENKLESGIVLLGWEVRAAREKMLSIDNSYIYFKNEEAYLYNSIFQLKTKNCNFHNNPDRARKLLLKKQELFLLKEKINHNNKYTAIILNLFWKNSWIKANIGIVQRKKQYDKRDIMNKNQWKLEKQHLIYRY